MSLASVRTQTLNAFQVYAERIADAYDDEARRTRGIDLFGGLVADRQKRKGSDRRWTPRATQVNRLREVP
ncbi:hypothetical protein THIOKS11580015 [Thiocapsa sp. KS1]|nr:hypothetical protein [Thiocapsa sp. KS1]CRI63822.1 hypothetical protein THIOKS11580015 [Thiocapsa sp. KS1]